MCLALSFVISINASINLIDSNNVTYNDTSTVKNELDNMFSQVNDLVPKNISAGTNWNFNYTGNVQRFIVPCNGVYRIAVFGAQAGVYNTAGQGANGASAAGNINLKKGTVLFIVIGGQSVSKNVNGYNTGKNAFNSGSSLGGSTHISLRNGLLKDLGSFKDDVLIVAGGGGDTNYLSSKLIAGSTTSNSAAKYKGNGSAYINLVSQE